VGSHLGLDVSKELAEQIDKLDMLEQIPEEDEDD